ncbi:MAG: (2Fe-2S)-binding protein [Steroidobacteraceae bacterium]
MFVCVCNAVRDRDLKEAARQGVRRFEDLQACTRVATCCGRCEHMAREVFTRALDPAPQSVQPA